MTQIARSSDFAGHRKVLTVNTVLLWSKSNMISTEEEGVRKA